MSLATDLTTIAENTPKVYEAGKIELVKNLDGFFYFFYTTQNQFLWEYVKKYADFSKIKNVSYMFGTCTWVKEFTLPANLLATNYMMMFQSCKSIVKVSGFDRKTSGHIYTSLFSGATSLEDAGIIYMTDCNYVREMFKACTSLKNVRLKGTVYIDTSKGNNGTILSLKDSANLSKDSILGDETTETSIEDYNVISLNGKKYYGGIVAALSTTATNHTLELSLAAVNKAFETVEGANNGSTSDEWLALRALRSNWTITLL